MAFDSIAKYKRIASQEGITTASAASKSAEVELGIESSYINSAFTEDSTTAKGTNADGIQMQMTSSENNGLNIDMSAYESALNSALRMAKTQMAIQTIGQTAGTLGTLFGGLAGNSTGSLSDLANIFKSSKTNNTPSTQKTAQSTADAAIKDLNLSNNLSDAIASYSKKGNDKNKAKLEAQITAAETDRQTLAGKYSEQTSIITKATEQKKALEEEVKQLNAEAIKLQSEVDTITDSITKAAEAEVKKLDEDDETQKGIIDKSQKDVEAKKKECTSAVAAQNKIISDETPNLQAMKTESYTTNVGGQIVTQTRQVPDEAKRSKAKSAIETAKKEIERLEKERDAFIEAEEQKQKEATDKIAENAVKRSEQQAIIAKPDTDPTKGAELQAKKTELGQKKSDVSDKEAKVAEQKAAINDATVLQTSCQTKMNTLSSQIVQARGLLG